MTDALRTKIPRPYPPEMRKTKGTEMPEPANKPQQLFELMHTTITRSWLLTRNDFMQKMTNAYCVGNQEEIIPSI